MNPSCLLVALAGPATSYFLHGSTCTVNSTAYWPSGPLLNTGFHFNVGNWPGHVDPVGERSGACDWRLSSKALNKSGDSEGIFLSVAHWYPPHTSCTYLIQGDVNEIVRLYFPR